MSAETKPTKPTTLFYSYSHVDEKHRNKLATHLALLKRQGVVSEWYDRQIIPGEKWEDKINENLAEADVILLLVSSDFIASEYCWSKEVAQALKRHADGSARVIPIIVRAVDWSGAPFGKLQALPKDAKPVTIWTNRDAAWFDVANGIRKEIESLANTKPVKAPAPAKAAAAPAVAKASVNQTKTPPPPPVRKRTAATPSAPKIKGHPRRIVYTANNTEEFPGAVARGEGDPPTGDAAVDEAYDGLGHVYLFFWNVFKRDSIDGKGMTLQATVHYGKGFDNAFWMGTQIVLGDGSKKLFNRFTSGVDIIAKEFTNGLIQSTTKLSYWGESGALFNSIACVFAVLVKQYQLKQTAVKADWLLGAGLLAPKINGVGINSLANPGTAYDDPVLGKDPQVSHMDNFVKTQDDNGGIHVNAGIPNRAFYTVATTLGGYAWEKAGRIWYEALHHKLLKSDTTFRGFARITAVTSGHIYGPRSAEAKAVHRAWEMVGIKVN